MSRSRIALLVGALLAIVAGVALARGGENVAYESPEYVVSRSFGPVELREYSAYLVAETRVDGDLESAGNSGFRILAKYIFGDNRGGEKIAMTAPVAQEKSEGAKIAMTAPVTQKREGDAFMIRFMMPSKFTRETLPVPNDSRIHIVEVPAKTLAAVRYSGRWTESNYREHLELLYANLHAEGFEPLGEPVWARYDPPFKPWFMRRNEILTAFQPRS